jgi:hypothetical protein
VPSSTGLGQRTQERELKNQQDKLNEEERLFEEERKERKKKLAAVQRLKPLGGLESSESMGRLRTPRK